MNGIKLYPILEYSTIYIIGENFIENDHQCSICKRNYSKYIVKINNILYWNCYKCFIGYRI